MRKIGWLGLKLGMILVLALPVVGFIISDIIEGSNLGRIISVVYILSVAGTWYAVSKDFKAFFEKSNKQG